MIGRRVRVRDRRRGPVAARLLAGALVALGAAGCGLTAPSSPSRTSSSSRPTGARIATPASRLTTAAASTASSSTRPTPPTAAAALAQARRTHEYPTPVRRQAVLGGWRSAAEAVEVFATTYINWSAGTVSARLTALSHVSIGQARSAMALAAAQTARDYELRRGGVGNAGVVEAIAPVRGQADQYAVITRERTTATGSSAYQGLGPAWHVTLATVTRIADGLWVVSAWQPES